MSIPMSIPPVIDMGNLPPKTAAVQRILFSTSMPVSLRCGSEILTVEPAELQAGRSWIRLRVHPHYLEDGIFIFTTLRVLSTDGEKQIIVRGSVKAGSAVSLPSICVPNDAKTLSEAYEIAAPGDCIMIGNGIWNAALVIEKPIMLRAVAGASVVLRGSDQPALVVRTDASLDHISLIGESVEGAIVCESGYLKMIHCQITAPFGDGLRLRGGGKSALKDVEITNCRGAGLEVQEKASVTLSSCQLHHNRQSNLKSGPNTQVEAVRSGFQRSRSGSGIWTQGFISMKDCSAFGNAHFGLFLEAKAQAIVQRGTFDQNGKAAIRAADTSSITLDKVRFPPGAPSENILADPSAIVATVL